MTRKTTRPCAEVLGLVSAYLDGDLAVSTCSEIERHCQTCPRCASVVAGLRRTVGMCRDAGRAEVPAAVRKQAAEHVRKLLAMESRRRLAR